MVDKELAVIHTRENFYLGIGKEPAQMSDLRFGDECLLGPIPEVDIVPVDGFQLVGIDILVTVTNSFSLAVGPHFSAFFQQDVEVVGMEHPLPEARPMVAGPDVGALVIPQRVHAPLRQRQQRRGIQNRVPDGYLVPFQDAGKDFPAEREAVGDIQAAVQIPLDVSDNLSGLIVNRGKCRFLPKQEAVDPCCYDLIPVFQDINQRKEYLCSFIDEALKVLFILNENNICHRDFLPSNLMVWEVNGRCRVGLIDFGWAVENNRNVVAHPLHLGGYYRHKDKDSDLYTLGSMLMEQWYDLPYVRRIAKVLRSKEVFEVSQQKQVLMEAKNRISGPFTPYEELRLFLRRHQRPRMIINTMKQKIFK